VAVTRAGMEPVAETVHSDETLCAPEAAALQSNNKATATMHEAPAAAPTVHGAAAASESKLQHVVSPLHSNAEVEPDLNAPMPDATPARAAPMPDKPAAAERSTVKLSTRLMELGFATSLKAATEMIVAGQVTHRGKRVRNIAHAVPSDDTMITVTVKSSATLLDWVMLKTQRSADECKWLISKNRIVWAGEPRLDPLQVISADEWAAHTCIVLPDKFASSPFDPALKATAAAAPRASEAAAEPPVNSLELAHALLQQRLAFSKDHARFLVKSGRVLVNGRPTRTNAVGVLSLRPAPTEPQNADEKAIVEYCRELSAFMRSQGGPDGNLTRKSADVTSAFLKWPRGAELSQRIRFLCSSTVAVLEYGKPFGLSASWSGDTVVKITVSLATPAPALAAAAAPSALVSNSALALSLADEVALAVRAAVRGMQNRASASIKPVSAELRAAAMAPLPKLKHVESTTVRVAPAPAPSTPALASSPAPAVNGTSPTHAAAGIPALKGGTLPRPVEPSALSRLKAAVVDTAPKPIAAPVAANANANANARATEPPAAATGSESALKAALVARKLALDEEDACALVANGMVKVDGVDAKSDSIAVPPSALIELHADVVKLRRLLPRACAPTQDAFSWPDAKQREILWALASVSYFVCNVGLEALAVGLVAAPEDDTPEAGARCTQALMSLFLDAGAVYLASRGVLAGVSRVIIERAVQRAVSAWKAKPAEYCKLAVAREQFIVGPSSEFFWPLVGAYNKPEEADTFLTNLLSPVHNAWIADTQSDGNPAAVTNAVLKCLLDLNDFGTRVKPGARAYLLSSRISASATKFAHRTRLARLCEELHGSIWEQGFRTVLVSVNSS